MTVKIKTINIHAFRGIPDLELQLDGKNLLLRGENGTGKSSIVEAIEFFFTGR
jgi:recombinational DNA repair ATPase RecF